MTRIYILLAGLFVSNAVVDAAVYKGQKIYIKKCRVCHEGGEKIATLRTMKGWKEYFTNNGVNVVSAHTGSKKVEEQIESLHAEGKARKLTSEKLEEYFNSSSYHDSGKHLRDFMVEYASDSGNVPACN